MPTQQSGEIEFNGTRRLTKTGFQAMFSNPVFERMFLDRLEESFPGTVIQKEERGPPKQDEDTQRNVRKLEELVEHSQKPLLKIKTVIPLNPFPTEVVVDINKVNIVLKEFFASENVHGVLIKDISDVVVECNPIFATLKIIDIGFTDNSIDVEYLRKKDAIKARKVIQGLVIAHKYGVDLSKIDDENLCDKVEELGSVNSIL